MCCWSEFEKDIHAFSNCILFWGKCNVLVWEAMCIYVFWGMLYWKESQHSYNWTMRLRCFFKLHKFYFEKCESFQPTLVLQWIYALSLCLICKGFILRSWFVGSPPNCHEGKKKKKQWRKHLNKNQEALLNWQPWRRINFLQTGTNLIHRSILQPIHL